MKTTEQLQSMSEKEEISVTEDQLSRTLTKVFRWGLILGVLLGYLLRYLADLNAVSK